MSNLFNILGLSQIILYSAFTYKLCTQKKYILKNNTETHFNDNFAAKTGINRIFILMMLLKSRKHFESI